MYLNNFTTTLIQKIDHQSSIVYDGSSNSFMVLEISNGGRCLSYTPIKNQFHEIDGSKPKAEPIIILEASPKYISSLYRDFIKDIGNNDFNNPDNNHASDFSTANVTYALAEKSTFVKGPHFIHILLVLAVLAGLLLGYLIPRYNPPTPAVNTPISHAENLGTPVIPSLPKSVEEINAEKGPQIPPPSNVAPPQPSIDLPSMTSVQPTEANPTIAPAGAVQQTTAPAATQSSSNPFGDRVNSAAESLAQATELARDTVETQPAEVSESQVNAMKQALDMINSGQKLPPEFVSQLPPEVASSLQSQGVVMTAEEANALAQARGQASANLVRIPTPLIDQRRDADGVPDIPEANSWVNFGANISLPPLGGGEITSAEDFARFGLQL